MKTDATSSSVEYKRGGVTVLIRPTIKNGVERFVLDYRVNGQRKLVWRSTLTEARKAASAAVDKITAGHSELAQLTNADATSFLRARDYLESTKVPLDVVAREYAEAMGILGGRASIAEACRCWVKTNDSKLPVKSIAEACAECVTSAKADGKSQRRLVQLSVPFNRFADDIRDNVSSVTPGLLSKWLSGLATGAKPLTERTRKNYRDAIGYLCRWCVLHGYLNKGTDWLENVQNYSARKLSEIEIYSPDELAKLITAADDGMVPFICISAFAGLRHAEVARLDWREIDLEDGFIEVRAANSKTGERRLVPIKDNLKAWLTPHRKDSGLVCDYANTTKQLLKIARLASVQWKHNGLRHSCISYRVAESADVPRVADESGNSVAMIRQHYLKRVKPVEAAKWFSIAPEVPENITTLKEAV
jgi:integrase